MTTGTSAEAQAFKRACSCFGLSRYLYCFDGVWVDLDERKQPKSMPPLPGWATPAGWAQGRGPISFPSRGSLVFRVSTRQEHGSHLQSPAFHLGDPTPYC